MCDDNGNHERTEWQLTSELVAGVATAMVAKLERQAARGLGGWNHPAAVPFLKYELQLHVQRALADPNQWVDVLNLAAFLWWHEARG